MVGTLIRRPVAVAMAYISIALLGVAAARNIPIELLPDTQLPRLFIEAEWRGASPEATEAFVTAPLEAAVQQVRGIERIQSISQERLGTGYAQVEAWFARGTDMNFARLELSERLAALEESLPIGVRPPTVRQYVPQEMSRQARRFLVYTITGPHTLEALRHHIETVIAPELLQIDGVGHVEASGGRDRIIEIELDENKIQALRLRPDEVRRRVMDLEFVREAGVVNTVDGTLRALAIRERPHSVAEIRSMPLLSDGGRMVRVDDVARVHDTYDEPQMYYRIDGRPAVSFEVHREVRTNAVRTADRVKSRLADIRALHPAGVRLILDEDESEDIRAQLSNLRNRALISAVIVLFVLLAFLRSMRAAVIVFVTIAFAILITVNIMYFGGLTLNLLTLMGLAMGFGLVVDNAIVVLENIYRRRRSGESADTAADLGVRQVALPILAATCTTTVVVIPFVYLQGELRIYYVPLAVVVGISLVASLFVAFTFIPSLAAKLLSRRSVGFRTTDGSAAGGEAARQRNGPSAFSLVRIYSGLIRGTLRFPWVTVALAALLFGGSYHLFDKHVNRGIVWGGWGQQRDQIDIRISLPRGEEMERIDELARFFEDRLARLPEVERFVTRVNPQMANITVTFPEFLNATEVPVAIKEQMVQYSLLFGGTDVRVYGYGQSFYGGGGGAAPNYSIKVLGYNYETVREIAEDLGRRFERFSRIREVDTNSAGSFFTRDRATELVVDIDRERLALHDVTARDLVAHVNASVRGLNQAGNLRVGGEEVRFAVKLEGHRDVDVQQLQELLVPGRNGAAVRLADVATVRERQVLNRVIRENQQYQRLVSYEFRGPTRLGDRIRDAVLEATLLPPGYTIEGRQTWAWSTEEKRQIYGVLAVAIVLVFMVTAALFESLRQPLCVLLTVPMALIGVFLIFYYTRASFTREAYIGVIMMAGIVVNNAILLVDYVNQLRRKDGMPLADALVKGTLERVRPVLMTSMTTIFGLLPLVLFSAGADANIWNALAYALIGGLASSTILVLTVTPALYLIFERRGERAVTAAAAAAAAG
jgi:hydrophobic/amphiphilic exporter-1 (mainly G- bacteria), HAE1 family